MELIRGNTAPAVWLAAAEHVLAQKKGVDFDVILHIAEPTVLTTEDKQVYQAVDEFLTSHGAFSVHTVAETIFPLDEYLRHGAGGVFKDYPGKIRTIQKGRKDGNWGSYAYRILRQKDADGTVFNPLKEMVQKIKSHGKYCASFEQNPGYLINEDEPFEDEIRIYNAATDRRRLYGGPCLSHLSIKVHDGHLRFNATYRSHYYVRRLLGNLVGLGRLQYFLARETGLKVGGLTINSTFARFDSGSGEGSGGRWTKDEARALLKTCRAIYTTTSAAA